MLFLLYGLPVWNPSLKSFQGHFSVIFSFSSTPLPKANYSWITFVVFRVITLKETSIKMDSVHTLTEICGRSHKTRIPPAVFVSGTHIHLHTSVTEAATFQSLKQCPTLHTNMHLHHHCNWDVVCWEIAGGRCHGHFLVDGSLISLIYFESGPHPWHQCSCSLLSKQTAPAVNHKYWIWMSFQSLT